MRLKDMLRIEIRSDSLSHKLLIVDLIKTIPSIKEERPVVIHPAMRGKGVSHQREAILKAVVRAIEARTLTVALLQMKAAATVKMPGTLSTRLAQT